MKTITLQIDDDLYRVAMEAAGYVDMSAQAYLKYTIEELLKKERQEIAEWKSKETFPLTLWLSDVEEDEGGGVRIKDDEDDLDDGIPF